MRIQKLGKHGSKNIVLIHVNTAELAIDAGQGKMIAQNEDEIPCQRSPASGNNAVSKGLCKRYVDYNKALDQGVSQSVAEDELPCGILTLCTREKTRLSEITDSIGAGILRVHKDAHLLVLDGGGRVTNASRTADQIGKNFDFSFPAYIYENLTKTEMARLFVACNTQRRMELPDMVNGMVHAGMLGDLVEKLTSAYNRNLAPKHANGQPIQMLSKVPQGVRSLSLGRFLSWITYGAINKTGVDDIAKCANGLSQKAIDTALRVMAIFHDKVGYSFLKRGKPNNGAGFLSANVPQSVFIRIALNHPFPESPTEKNCLTKENWEFFFDYLTKEKGDGDELKEDMRTQKSSGGSGRQVTYDYFTASPEAVSEGEKGSRMSRFFVAPNEAAFKVSPKFAAQNRPDMFEGGTTSSFWNPHGRGTKV